MGGAGETEYYSICGFSLGGVAGRRQAAGGSGKPWAAGRRGLGSFRASGFLGLAWALVPLLDFLVIVETRLPFLPPTVLHSYSPTGRAEA